MKIVCAGECAVDLYSTGIKRVGGTSLNTARVIKSNFPEIDVSIISAVGTDDNGKLVTDEISKNQLTPFLQYLNGITATQEISIEKNGEKKFGKYSAGVLKSLKLNDNQHAEQINADIVSTVCFEQIEEFFKEIIRNSKGIVVADFMDLSDYGGNTDIVRRYLKNINIVFVGLKLSDIKTISNLKELSTNGKVIVITLGENGAIAYFNEEKYEVKPQELENIVDTTGAGDAFIAGFICEYFKEKDIQKSLEKGSILSTATIQRLGI